MQHRTNLIRLDFCSWPQMHLMEHGSLATMTVVNLGEHIYDGKSIELPPTLWLLLHIGVTLGCTCGLYNTKSNPPINSHHYSLNQKNCQVLLSDRVYNKAYNISTKSSRIRFRGLQQSQSIFNWGDGTSCTIEWESCKDAQQLVLAIFPRDPISLQVRPQLAWRLESWQIRPVL